MKAAAALLFPLVLTVVPCLAGPQPYLHLDAAAQRELRNQSALPPLGPDRAVDMILAPMADGSTAALQSPIVAHRPVFHTDGTVAFLRFDGGDDYLCLAGPRKLTASATVLILAAPKANPGFFRGFFALSEFGKNDYTAGLNLDLGPNATESLSVINLESAGTEGARDLLLPGQNLAADLPFGGFHLFTVRSQIKPEGDEVWIDGLPLAKRDRLESNIGFDQFVLGARYYSNDPAQQPFIGSFLKADIAEVMVFDTALGDQDLKELEDKMLAKLPVLNAFASGQNGHALETLQDAPPVQMLVPGFSVSELPVKLTNRNNLRYRHDGKLVTLGYDGTIHLLTDTDGDGLEDKAAVFWDKPGMRGPLGMALLPKGDPRGDGVIVPSKGKVSLILDKDRDGRADEEIIVASGWQEIPQNVDAVGVAVDPKDGSIYFCLGCANYANPYLIDPVTGKAAYDVKSERGTIQKVSADFKTRTTVCTGVRFACALGFNREGDLFATEQEGATWLPNGNPLDELLHIQEGKHYGFPPRHPKHLPDVTDWPAVAEYGPQHQSTVGMCFNESVNGGPTFGPDFWAGDAIVCGESRGKLYRTKLVKTPHGYVAQNNLIACLGLLTVDACVSPCGDLLVACHSGPPDWGTGPKGEGRIFKITHPGKEIPQPVWQWASAPDEFRVAFDKELNPEEWKGLIASTDRYSPNSLHVRSIRIEAGTHVMPGDRFEVIRPGYQVVRDQMAAARQDVEVLGLSLSAARRTIILRVPRQTDPVGYAVTLPLPESWIQKSAIPQKPEMDVLVTLNGVGVVDPTDEAPQQVLPHPVSAVSLKLLEGWDGLKDYWKRQQEKLPAPYALGFINIVSPVFPAIQPGATLDWISDETLTGKWDAIATPLREYGWPPLGYGVAISGGKKSWFPTEPDRKWAATLGASLLADELLLAESSDDDPSAMVPISPQRLFVPWARAVESGNLLVPVARSLPGNWLAGRRVFFSAEAACSTCHQIRSEGIAVGPDLTNLTSRDSGSVLRDILQPSAAINPDHPASTVKLKSGGTLTGIVRTTNDKELKIALQAGAVQVLNPADVASVELLKTSLMPEDYAGRLTKEQQTDLLKFLLENPLEPAPVEITAPPLPPARTQAEVAAVLGQPRPISQIRPVSPLRILLSAGPKDHGPGEHDYPLWQKRWTTLLGLAPGVTLDTSWEFPTAGQLAAADVTVFFSKNPGFNPRTAMLLDEYQQRGGGLVYLHWAIEGGEHANILAERIGLASDSRSTRYRHGGIDLVFPQPEHPVTKGFSTLHFTDETYWNLAGEPGKINLLGTAVEDGKPQPQFWSTERGKGRVIGCVPGHYTWTFDDPLYRLLVLRAICWTGNQEDADRLAELATVGARIAP